MNEEDNNPDLFKLVTTDNELKRLLVNYVGEKLNPEDDLVTAEMVLQALAAEFLRFCWWLRKKILFVDISKR